MNRMPDINDTSPKISVILSLYKRPQHLSEQLDALAAQSLPPDEILLFQDRAEDAPDIAVPECLAGRFTRIEKADKNVGVWGRFNFARSARNDYVCVFDDDTVPGHRWLEHCYSHMQRQEGIYGTIGILCKDPAQYPADILRFGWAAPHSRIKQVDFLGHSWFFKKQWLDYMFNAPQSVKDLHICGEDMSLSYMALKHAGIPSFVPPHPEDNYEFFGSIPEKGASYGADNAGLSGNSTNLQRYNTAMNILLRDGWETLSQKNPNILIKMKAIRIISSCLVFKKPKRALRNRLADMFL